MDARHFDALAKTLSVPDSRRRLLALLATLPEVGGLLSMFSLDNAQAKDRRRRRKQRHNKRKNPGKRKGKRNKCKPEPVAQTCAGTCGSVTNRCKKTVDCGLCTCASGCPQCQTCDPATGQCVPVANDTPCDDSDACTQTDTCQNGVCVGGSPVVCPADECQDPGTCNPVTGQCSAPTAKVNRTSCSDGRFCCNGACCDGCCSATGDTGGTCGVCRVFVTSTTYNGNLGGITGANANCQGLAEAASQPGIYKAWLSDDTGAPVNNFPCTAASCSAQGYTLVDGSTVVANDWVDLTTCEGPYPQECLAHAIDMDETGASVGLSAVWTNTVPDGNISGASSCGNWSAAFGQSNAAGQSNLTNEWWTELTQPLCSDSNRLYCFQQV